MKPTTLPRSLDELRGLRAARWIRESRKDQLAGTGPEDQRHEQDDAIERFGLVDTGLEWVASHSGWKDRAIEDSDKWADMLARAGTDYDVLIVGYVSRFCRNVDIGTTIRKQIHAQGATIYFCDDRILLSDDQDWKKWADLLVAAEWYARDLKHKMERTHKARFRNYAEPGGMPPLGFRRVGPDKQKRLEVDPDTIEQGVRVFELYGIGTYSAETLAAATGLHTEAIKPMLRNRIYNGWVQRYGEWKPATWRNSPPVDDELWERCTSIRESRNRGAGPRRKDRPDLLDGLLYCGACGQRLWSEGVDGTGQRRKRHREPCAEWGQKQRLRSQLWELPISDQLSQIDLSNRTLTQIVAAFAAPPPMPNEIGHKQVEREKRELAQRYAAGDLTEAEFMAAVESLRERERGLSAAPVASQTTAAVAIEYLRNLESTWHKATRYGLLKEQADVAHAVYEQIGVVGSDFVGVKLTQEAKEHGLALALPEQVVLSQVARVGGEGLEPPTSSV